MTKTNGSRKGFTLAEVLITLGIIGVVAAMTIPTLIQNTNSVKFATQFKKDISTLSQAALMAQAQYDTDYASTTAACSTTAGGAESLVTGAPTICGILNTTLAGKTFLGLGDSVKSASNSTEEYTWNSMVTLNGKLGSMIVYTLADGSLIGFNKDAYGCSVQPGQTLNEALLRNAVAASGSTQAVAAGGLNKCIGFIDVNGTALPNKETVCDAEVEDNATTKLDPSASCTVTNKASTIGDIFPIVFHDGTVEPATNAGKAVLTRGK